MKLIECMTMYRRVSSRDCKIFLFLTNQAEPSEGMRTSSIICPGFDLVGDISTRRSVETFVSCLLDCVSQSLINSVLWLICFVSRGSLRFLGPWKFRHWCGKLRAKTLCIVDYRQYGQYFCLSESLLAQLNSLTLLYRYNNPHPHHSPHAPKEQTWNGRRENVCCRRELCIISVHSFGSCRVSYRRVHEPLFAFIDFSKEMNKKKWSNESWNASRLPVDLIIACLTSIWIN